MKKMMRKILLLSATVLCFAQASLVAMEHNIQHIYKKNCNTNLQGPGIFFTFDGRYIYRLINNEKQGYKITIFDVKKITHCTIENEYLGTGSLHNTVNNSFALFNIPTGREDILTLLVDLRNLGNREIIRGLNPSLLKNHLITLDNETHILKIRDLITYCVIKEINNVSQYMVSNNKLTCIINNNIEEIFWINLNESEFDPHYTPEPHYFLETVPGENELKQYLALFDNKNARALKLFDMNGSAWPAQALLDDEFVLTMEYHKPNESFNLYGIDVDEERREQLRNALEEAFGPEHEDQL